ncbi:iron-containing alcohol dehydrogenase [Streptomyces sp. SAI-127]|uniref:iron-containing alcohol dehydrogenase n=1 Tax=Streptomyces sp. SAI-127 TaxID=2940543 RepID=UPI002475EB30|nr:iron-containing alcohol dehydrogenase [Streptomyces sp. SAI-127]
MNRPAPAVRRSRGRQLTAPSHQQLGAHPGGSASAGPGMHHEVCHELGGAFVLPHTTLHAAALPYVLAFNAPASPRSWHSQRAGRPFRPVQPHRQPPSAP